mmetsp:Transcript_12497/g.53720  ORF Transcript_12497/g.53720 Transcript_12497/m.53720 type:complete len:208 (-) Transcript_12497:266-889(-)
MFLATRFRTPIRPKFLTNGSHGKRLALSPMPIRSASCPPCQGLSANFGEQKLFEIETLFVLETNIDDMSPQVLAFTMEELLASGGLDVWAAPVLMKKNRSGTILGVICNARCVKELTELIFRETTTLGVRVRSCKRVSVHRQNQLVSTRWGPVQIKVGSLGEYPINVQAEYEDCAELARRRKVPLKDLLREAVHSYYRENSDDEAWR